MEVIKRRKLVWDLEANGLLKGNKRSEPVSKVWMIAAIDIETQEEFFFCDYVDDCPDLLEFKKLFDNAKELIGHNIVQTNQSKGLHLLHEGCHNRSLS